jgi:hypothetical protein
MLGVIDSFLDMEEDRRESFIVGRRIGRYRRLADFQVLPEVEDLKRRLKEEFPTLEDGLLQILWNYI